MPYPTTLSILELVEELQKRDNEQKSINARVLSEIIEIKNRLDALECSPPGPIEPILPPIAKPFG